MPGVLDLRVIPRYDGRREVGEGHYGEEEEHKEPEAWHEYGKSAGMRGLEARRLEI